MNRFTRPILTLAGAALLLLLLALAVAAQTPSGPAQHPIKVPGDYDAIQQAIDAAQAGEEIWVASGKYEENLSISKGITLSGGWDADFTKRSPGESTIDGRGVGRAISITCALSDTVVTIDGFTVRGGNATGLGGGPETLGVDEAPRLETSGIAGDRPAFALDPTTPAQHLARLRVELADAAAAGLVPGGAAASEAVLDRVQQQIDRLGQVRSRPQTPAAQAQQATDCGGGIYSWNASLHLLNSTIEGNLASLSGNGCGGGVFVGRAPHAGVLIRYNTLQDNIASAAPAATAWGGGLYATEAPGLVLENNAFEENTAMSAGLVSAGEGGGLLVDASPAAVVRANQFVRNTASAGWDSRNGVGGGAVVRWSDGALVTDNEFRENLGFVHAQSGGGGLVVVKSAQAAVLHNQLVGNWAGIFQPDMALAEGGGMALWQTDGIAVMYNDFAGNTAVVSGADIGPSYGGGLEVETCQGARVERNTFRDNVATQTAGPTGEGNGGGAALWAVSDSWVGRNIFTGNAASLSHATGNGGGLFLLNTTNCRVELNDFEGNLGGAGRAGHGGGLCVFSQPEATGTAVDANRFVNNRAAAVQGSPDDSDGGACTIYSYGLDFTNNVVAGNRASAAGGLYLWSPDYAVLTNNTLAGNSDAAIVFDPHNTTPITLTNNIVVSHTVGISVPLGVGAAVRYTLWHGNGADIAGDGVITHTHPVTGAPAFVDPPAGDYRITILSAARDAGDPVGVPPAPDHDADWLSRPQGAAVDIGAYEWQGYWTRLPLVVKNFTPRAGWAIGDGPDGAVIVHTSDGGLTWQAQGTPTLWTGLSGNDISAVDDQTAWAALGSGPAATDGAILHTTDGGVTWIPQAIPAGLTGGIKGVKGLSPTEAWAASLGGVILHTTDGGATWNVVPHPTIPITDVNRIDALGGADVWIAAPNEGHGGNTSMIHTQDNGLTWRQEPLPTVPAGHGPMTVNAASPLVAWTALNQSGNVYRTLDGGTGWQLVTSIDVGANDADDLCAAGPQAAWVVLTPGTGAGMLWRVHVAADGSVDSREFLPASTAFSYEGITCLDERTVWAVGGNPLHVQGLPLGVIVSSTDGGEHWVQGSAPADIEYWKVSFAGARR
jgi:photosystem II stability/assembly factor-like uncharacterized protein